MKKAILGLFLIVLLALVIGFALSLLNFQRPGVPLEEPEIQDLHGYTVVYVGEGNNISIPVVIKMWCLGAQVILLREIPESMELNDSFIVMFDTEWIQEKIDDTRLHDFLRNAAPKEVKLVVIGGNTSKFFEALDKAGVYEIPVTETGHVRNPAYNNPPLAGLKMKKAYYPNGYEYLYPSMLCSGTNNTSTLVKALIEW